MLEMSDKKWQEEHKECPGYGKYSTSPSVFRYCGLITGTIYNQTECTQANCPFEYWRERWEKERFTT